MGKKKAKGRTFPLQDIYKKLPDYTPAFQAAHKSGLTPFRIYLLLDKVIVSAVEAFKVDDPDHEEFDATDKTDFEEERNKCRIKLHTKMLMPNTINRWERLCKAGMWVYTQRSLQRSKKKKRDTKGKYPEEKSGEASPAAKALQAAMTKGKYPEKKIEEASPAAEALQAAMDEAAKRLKVGDQLERNEKDPTFKTSIDTKDIFAIQRVVPLLERRFLVTKYTRKGKNPQGSTVLTAAFADVTYSPL